MSQIEACFANEQAYTNCMPKADGTLGGDATGLSIGNTGGNVNAAVSGKGYVVTGTSKSGNTFLITKADDGSTSRSCNTGGSGGCPTGGKW